MADRDGGATASTSSATSEDLAQPPPPPPPPPESCVKYFDALWFCYSPGHQLKQFYRYGNVDDCTGAWSQLWACLSKRTVRFAPDSSEEDSSKRKHPLWELRTREEAKAAWDAEFGHLDAGGGGDGGGENAKEGGKKAGKGGGGGLHAEAGEAIP